MSRLTPTDPLYFILRNMSKLAGVPVPPVLFSFLYTAFLSAASFLQHAMEPWVVTHHDLETFRKALLDDVKKLLNEKHGRPARKWLKSHEVRRLLTISPGTLQNLRVNGTLPYTKIGGVIFYDYEDIHNMLEQRKTRLYDPTHLRDPNQINAATRRASTPPPQPRVSDSDP
jgi:hypothetical protein